MLHEQEARISSLFGQVLTSIEEAFTATRPGITKDGERYDLGPDHYARLAAAKRFIELVTAGRPIPKAPEPQATNRLPTWTEFQSMLQASRSAPGKAD